MLANPRKVRRRRRKVVSVSLRRRATPRRRRISHIKLGARHLVRRRRRSNPSGHRQSLGGALGLVRLGLFGGVGIVVARIAGSLYTQYVAPTVVGTDSTQTWRQYASEFLRLLTMGVASWGVSRALSRVGNMVRPQDAQALMIGGLAETGRQAIGVLYKSTGGTSAATYGLDGRGYPQAFQDSNGQVYQFNPQRGGYELAGVVPASAFAGMGGVVPASAFAGR